MSALDRGGLSVGEDLGALVGGWEAHGHRLGGDLASICKNPSYEYSDGDAIDLDPSMSWEAQRC